MRFFIFLVFISNLFSQVDYNNDIQPIFQSRCISCHGYSGGLNLTSYSNLMNGGNSGPSVEDGNHSSSLLYIRVENGTMPPIGTLEPDQINLIAQWIDEGALETPATNYTGPVWHIATTGSDTC